MRMCLVTGGAGFIGSHLAETLSADGWKVRVLDDLSSGKRENLAQFGGFAERVQFIEGSVLDRRILAEAMAGVEIVFHEAAKVSVPQSVLDPESFHAVCATGTLAVLLAAREAGVRRLVYAASSSCYGNTDRVPTTEDAPLAPMSPYAAAKLAGEHYCEAFAATSNLQTVRLRYFNVFGPRQDPSSPYSGVISIFCTKLLARQTPMIHGDGLQSRDFVYVADVVQANVKAALAEGVSGRVFNVGRGSRSTVLDLVSALNQRLGTTITPVHGPTRLGDVRDSQADITLARSLLGYEPRVSFAEGIGQCLDYYRAAGR